MKKIIIVLIILVVLTVLAAGGILGYRYFISKEKIETSEESSKTEKTEEKEYMYVMEVQNNNFEAKVVLNEKEVYNERKETGTISQIKVTDKIKKGENVIYITGTPVGELPELKVSILSGERGVEMPEIIFSYSATEKIDETKKLIIE